MATTTLVPTSVSDPQANISSGAVTDVDNTIAGADDGALIASVANNWAPGVGTGSAFTFTMQDVPADFGSINTVQFRIRGRRQGTSGGDTWGVTGDVTGANAPTATAVWTQADGTAFANRGAGSPVSSSASAADINGWQVRVYQHQWTQDKGKDGMFFDLSEVEIILDYNVAAVVPPPQQPRVVSQAVNRMGSY